MFFLFQNFSEIKLTFNQRIKEFLQSKQIKDMKEIKI